MIYISFFLTVFLVLYAAMAWQAEKKERIQRRISALLTKNNQEENTPLKKEEKQTVPFRKRVIEPVWQKLSRFFQKKLTGDKEAKLELMLLQAGNPFRMTPADFRLVKIILLILLPLIFAGYTVISDFSKPVVLLSPFFGLLAARYLPMYYINQKKKARILQAVRELPDFLDLLTVSLEAGLGFDSALNKVVSKKEGVLSQEFQSFLEEIRLGKTRRAALTGIRNRLLVDDIQTLISSIIQAEQLGVSVVQILRVQSNEIRERRKQRAEEAAMKAPIKMLFPLVFFIFPSLFIVLLGPAVIQIMRDL